MNKHVINYLTHISKEDLLRDWEKVKTDAVLKEYNFQIHTIYEYVGYLQMLSEFGDEMAEKIMKKAKEEITYYFRNWHEEITLRDLRNGIQGYFNLTLTQGELKTMDWDKYLGKKMKV